MCQCVGTFILAVQLFVLCACKRAYGANLTNIRYADDLLLFAQTRDEAVRMMESLAKILALFGLELNAKKTRIFCSSDDPFQSRSRVKKKQFSTIRSKRIELQVMKKRLELQVMKTNI